MGERLMRFQRVLSAAVAATLFTAVSGTAGEPKYYPYPASANYCPAGLQPVSIGGIICCGTPNQSHTYAAAMSHPAPKRHKPRVSHAECPVGVKGC